MSCSIRRYDMLCSLLLHSSSALYNCPQLCTYAWATDTVRMLQHLVAYVRANRKKSVENRRVAVSRTASMLLVYFNVHAEVVASVRDGLLGPGERKFRRGREWMRVGLHSRHRVNATH
jgi:hypothetical protein